MGERWKKAFRSNSKINDYTENHHLGFLNFINFVVFVVVFLVLIPFCLQKNYNTSPVAFFNGICVCFLAECCVGRGWW